MGGSKIIDTTVEVEIYERFCALTIKERTPDIHTNKHIYYICIQIYWRYTDFVCISVYKIHNRFVMKWFSGVLVTKYTSIEILNWCWAHESNCITCANETLIYSEQLCDCNWNWNVYFNEKLQQKYINTVILRLTRYQKLKKWAQEFRMKFEMYSLFITKFD